MGNQIINFVQVLAIQYPYYDKYDYNRFYPEDLGSPYY